MKISAATLALLPVLSSSVDAAFSPARFSFDAFVKGESNEQMLEAFQDVGIISITDIPNFDSKFKALNALPSCINESPESSKELRFPDGTRRRTLACHSKGSTETSPVEVADHEACADFKEWSQTFREMVGLVVETLSVNMAGGLKLDQSKPLLLNEAQEGFALTDVFAQGDHLEHFHSYDSKEDSSSAEETIEWHTDQGLALVFTPGMVNGEPTDGFYVKLADGSTEMVDFQKEDDLVILLGDGVNQYLNRALDPEQRPLRALPHALHMPTTSDPRVWYGRMVLPPAEALHPAHPLTFGEIRDGMIEEDIVSTSIGCSNDLVARELEEVTCENGTAAFCWHRCMNYTDYDVSPEICAEEGLDLACINGEGLLWDGIHNPAFAIGCVNINSAETFVTTADDEKDGDDHDGDDHDGDGDDHDHDKDNGMNNGMNDGGGSSAHGLVIGMALVASTIVSALLF